jgi:hypothetical protein
MKKGEKLTPEHRARIGAGLKRFDASLASLNHLTVPQLAERWNVSRRRAFAMILSKQFGYMWRSARPGRRRRRHLIPLALVERFESIQRASLTALRLTEAAKRWDVCADNASTILKHYKLQTFTFGGCLRIPLNEIERFESMAPGYLTIRQLEERWKKSREAVSRIIKREKFKTTRGFLGTSYCRVLIPLSEVERVENRTSTLTVTAAAKRLGVSNPTITQTVGRHNTLKVGHNRLVRVSDIERIECIMLLAQFIVYPHNCERNCRCRQPYRTIPEVRLAAHRAASDLSLSSDLARWISVRRYESSRQWQAKNRAKCRDYANKYTAKLRSFSRPVDWGKKPVEHQIIGAMLLSQDYMSNEELFARLDRAALPCRYGKSWTSTANKKDRDDFIWKIRRWVGKPGRHGKPPSIRLTV